MSPLTGSKFPSADTLVYSLLNLPISSYLDQVLKSTPNMWQDAISEVTTCDIYTNLRVLYSWFRCVALAPINSIEWPMNDRYKQSAYLHYTVASNPLFLSLHYTSSLLPWHPLLPVLGEPWSLPCSSCCCILRWRSSRLRPQPPIALTSARRIVLRDANP